MVSETKESIKNIQTPTYPVRIKFEKRGRLQYISHLDLNRTLSRAMIRAGVPIWYTEGFNPHPKLVFATPLSLGAESLCEFCDIKTIEPPDCASIKDALSATLPEGLQIIDVYTQGDVPMTKFSTIAFSEYSIKIFTTGADDALATKCADILAAPLKVTKRSKRGGREIDLSTLIERADLHFDESEGALCLDILLPADSANFTNPELVISALIERADILRGDVTSEYYSILRTQLYLSDKVTPFR